MGRRAISITLAVVCLAVLLGATGLFAISRETSYMQECASEGFAIDGYYRDDKTSLETLAFLEEDNHRWQLVDDRVGNVGVSAPTADRQTQAAPVLESGIAT